MATTKFKARYLSQYLIELFGNQDYPNGLLRKNLSQKVKFQLKKLGSNFQDEQKAINEQLREIFNKYSEDKTEEDGKVKRLLKEEDKEQFTKEAEELDELELDIQHYDFKEDDFIDQKTGQVVGGDLYFNLIDILVYEKGEKKEEKIKVAEEAEVV